MYPLRSNPSSFFLAKNRGRIAENMIAMLVLSGPPLQTTIVECSTPGGNAQYDPTNLAQYWSVIGPEVTAM